MSRFHCIRGEGLQTGLKNAFQNKLQSRADKILFKITRFFKLQNVVKFQFISIKARGGFNNNA